MFVNLYIQSEYSMLSSSISIHDLMDFCILDKQKAITLTDNGMYGAFKFYKSCQDKGIKPIIGLRLLLNDGFYNNVVLVYARNYIGYQSLLKLATKQANKEFITLEDLSYYKDNLIIVLASDEHELIRLVRDHNDSRAEILLNDYIKALDIFYCGLDRQTKLMCNEFNYIIQWFDKRKVRLLALHRSAFFKEDYSVYTTLRTIDLGVGNFFATEKESNMHLLSNEEAYNLFSSYPTLLENTVLVANMCNLEIPLGTYRMPSFGMENSKEYLAALCKVGLNKRLVNRKVDVEHYKKRLLHELNIIDKMGYNDYFLIVYDYVKYAKQNGILVGAGRGSAPGSLVIYALGITEVDPLEYNLLFERFLNPERISMPDIDVDFPDDKREEVINYIANRFGVDKVAYITTFGTFGAKMAIRDVARVMQINEQRLKVLLKPVSDQNMPLNVLLNNNSEIISMMANDEDANLLYKLALKLEGLPRHTSTHAAGIIMADGDLISYTALQKGLGGLWQTQYEASDLETLGLVKMDILGLKNLNIIKRVLDMIKETTQDVFNIYHLPLDDKKTYEMIASGETDGVFQLESRGMRKLLSDLKTSTFMDIVNANALYRPGPMDMIPIFINRKFGEKVIYPHEDLKEILAPTYGTIVYQEQIILIAERFAGYTLGMADLLRRAVAKKDLAVLESERIRFVRSAVKKGYQEKLSNEIYDYIVKFANYGFNKSHSVAYAMIAYQMAYLKAHYFAYFMAVLLSNSVGSASVLKTYISICRSKGLEVILPNINFSTTNFVLKDNYLIYPFTGITNIGSTTANEIIKNRQEGLYKDYDDFIQRTVRFLNKRQVAYLIYAGTLDSFGLSRRHMIENYDEAILRTDYSSILGTRIIQTKETIAEYSFDEITALEKEALGFNLKYNLLNKYHDFKKQKNTVNICDLVANQNAKVLFIISRLKIIKTKNSEKMAFLEIHDDSGTIDAVIFPHSLQNLQITLEEGFVYFGFGRTEKRNDRLQFIFENIFNIK